MTVDDATPLDPAANSKRVLLVSDDAIAAEHLAAGLASGECIVTQTSSRDDDLFAKALDHDTLIYLPAKSFLHPPRLEGPRVEEEVRAVLGAANAPGVNLLVVALPARVQAEIVEAAVQHSGVPYFIVRSPALIEELRYELAGEVPKTVWAPRCDGAALGQADTLVRAVRGCFVDDRQGRTIELAATLTDIPSALRRVLSIEEGRVVSVWPPIFRVGRAATRILCGHDAPYARLIDALLARRDEPSAPPQRAA